jgi:hypothetical protein
MAFCLAEAIISQKDDRATLLALALTCRAFTNPALSVLWRNLPSLTPLVKLIPETMLSERRLTEGEKGMFTNWGLCERRKVPQVRSCSMRVVAYP